MLRAAWKSLLGRKFRLLLSALSIVLGVAFVSGSLMFTNLLGSSFDQILKGALADVNVQATSSGGGPSLDGGSQLVPEQVRQDVAAVDGVAEAAGVITGLTVYPLDADGKVIAFGGAPGIASNWFTTPAAGGTTSVEVGEGRPPEADDEIAADATTLRRVGIEVGDELDVATPRAGVQTYTVVGSAGFGGAGTAGASYLFFTEDEARRVILDGAEGYTSLWVAAAPEVDVEAVTDDVVAVLPEGFEAASGEELAAELEDQLSIGLSLVNTFLLVFAAIALVVAALLILNTFSILVAQRARELALLRALGAKRGQVQRSVLFEALVVAVLGATLGIAAGYGLAWLIAWGLRFAGIDLGDASPTLTWQAITASYAVAIIITLLAATIPARRASRTRPVEAMTAAAINAPAGIDTPVLIGLGILQIGLGAIISAVLFDVPRPLVWLGIGALLVLVGCVLAAAVIGAPLVWLFGRLYRALFGEIGKMAELNARRQPRRTAATAATLMIGLTLVSAVAILAASTADSVRSDVTADLRGDFQISPTNFRPFDADVVDEVTGIDGVDAVHAFQSGGTTIDGESLSVTGTSPEGLAEGTSVDLLAGGLTDATDSAVISYDVHQDLDLQLGERFEAATLDGGSLTLLVTGILDGETGGGMLGDLVVRTETFPQLGDASLVDTIRVSLADGADVEAVRAGLEESVADFPTVVVTDNEEYAETLVAQFSQVFATIYALLALAIVISVLGIVNTLGLSILERTREIGLLRAVGTTRPQLRLMVTLESVVVAVLGSVLGVLLGLGFGVALVWLLRADGLSVLTVPWGQLGIFVAAAAGFGVVAAIGPARRAARMDVLEAIAQE